MNLTNTQRTLVLVLEAFAIGKCGPVTLLTVTVVTGGLTLRTHCKCLKNIKEAMVKVEGALIDVTELTSIKDSNRTQIDYLLDPD